MQEFGAWYFDLARSADGTFQHQGPPGLRKDKYAGWDCTGAYLLSYAMPLKKLRLTGRKQGVAPHLKPDAANLLIADGRGWSNKDRNSYYDKLRDEELLDRLASWSPIVRKRAAMTLTRRKADVMPALIKLLETEDLEPRYGACLTLALMKNAVAQAIPALSKTLEEDDLWLRIRAAEALASIGEPAMSTVPKLLEMLVRGPSMSDPRGMEQRYLCFAIFGQMLKRSLDGVDRELLQKAVAAGLLNEDGRARGSVGNVYKQLTYREVKPLLPAIHEAIASPAPSGVMFASGIRLAGLDVLATHRIGEGIPLCIDVMEIDKWGKRDRLKKCLTTLRKYGSAAKPILPRLRQLETELLAHREAQGLKPQIDQLRTIIKEIENGTETIELRSLK